MGTSLTLAAFAGVTVNPTDGVSASSTSPPSRTSYAHTNLASTQRMYTHARCCPTHARGPVANGMNAGPLNRTFNPPSPASREPVSASPDVGTPSAPLPSTSAPPALNDVRRVRSVAHSRLDTSHRFGTNASGFSQALGSRCTAWSHTPAAHPSGNVKPPGNSSPPPSSASRTSFRATNGATGWSRKVSRSTASSTGTCSLVRHAGRFPPFPPFSSPTRDTPVAPTHTTSCNPSPVTTCGSRVKLARSVPWVLTSDASRSSAHDSVAD